MDAGALAAMLADLDGADIVRHGFTPTMRDYEIVSERAGVGPTRHVFTHCVIAHVESSVAPSTWRGSLDDDRLVAPAGDDGFDWARARQRVGPDGAVRVVDASLTARRWRGLVGVTFHEVRIVAEAHAITLVFSGLRVEDGTPPDGQLPT